MKNNNINRREFIKTCLTTTAAISTFSCQKLFSPQKTYDAKGLPTITLGKTGVRVPRIIIGCGSRFCNVKDPEQSAALLNYALDQGFYHWDTAHDYVYNDVVSEERLGLILKDRRKEVFLSTKIGKRTHDEAMRDVEESLKRLKTDKLDLLQIHSIQSLEDVDKIGAEGGVLKTLTQMKDEKVTRFIGFSGHSSAEAMMAMVERYEFDTMLIALNHYAERIGDFEKAAIPLAAEKKMGVLAMKVIRPREMVESVTPEQLIRYALSLQDVNAAAIGTDSIDVVDKNATLLKNFKPMSQEEIKKMSVALAPFFQSQALPWMQPGYCDGMPA